MDRRHPFLPFINGDRYSTSTAKRAANSSQKQPHAVDDVMWKNPSLKKPWKYQRETEESTKFGDLQYKSELFQGYNISTPEANEITTKNRAAYVKDFVKNYAYKRESEFPKFNSKHSSRLGKKQQAQEWTISKKNTKALCIPTLHFTEEVIQYMGDPNLSSYFSSDMKELYKIKDLSISPGRRKNNDKSLKSSSRQVLTRKHALCMPDSKGSTLELPPKSKSFLRKKETEENILKTQVGKSTHLWEKYVLGLISKQTAQWIANRCSTGEQRGRLIAFLDEKYEIKDLEKNGAATVNKILSIDDDAITFPKKEKFNPQTAFENLRSDT